MKVTIVGVGAIGGFIGARLAANGKCDVSAYAQGDTLAALRTHGWRLHQGGKLIQSPARASEDAQSLGVQDLVIIALKGPVLPKVASALSPLIGSKTMVMPAMNGVPWWFGMGTPMGDEPLRSVDPEGTVAQHIPLTSVLGCVVHASSTRPEPGVVKHIMGQGLILGEALGGTSVRARQVGELLEDAGFDITVSSDVRYDIWYKLWGNLTMNPVSAMTGATIDCLLADPLVREFCSNAMREASAIGKLIGCNITQEPEDRHAVTAKLGAFKTSMLQDAQAGRAIELDSIVTAVYEMGRRLNLATPNIDALLGLTRLFARTHALYPQAQ